MAIILLSKFEDGETAEIRRGLMQIALGQEAELPEQRTKIQLDTVQLDDYIGSYDI